MGTAKRSSRRGRSPQEAVPLSAKFVVLDAELVALELVKESLEESYATSGKS